MRYIPRYLVFSTPVVYDGTPYYHDQVSTLYSWRDCVGAGPKAPSSPGGRGSQPAYARE